MPSSTLPLREPATRWPRTTDSVALAATAIGIPSAIGYLVMKRRGFDVATSAAMAGLAFTTVTASLVAMAAGFFPSRPSAEVPPAPERIQARALMAASLGSILGILAVIPKRHSRAGVAAMWGLAAVGVALAGWSGLLDAVADQKELEALDARFKSTEVAVAA